MYGMLMVFQYAPVYSIVAVHCIHFLDIFHYAKGHLSSHRNIEGLFMMTRISHDVDLHCLHYRVVCVYRMDSKMHYLGNRVLCISDWKIRRKRRNYFQRRIYATKGTWLWGSAQLNQNVDFQRSTFLLCLWLAHNEGLLIPFIDYYIPALHINFYIQIGYILKWGLSTRSPCCSYCHYCCYCW